MAPRGKDLIVYGLVAAIIASCEVSSAPLPVTPIVRTVSPTPDRGSSPSPAPTNKPDVKPSAVPPTAIPRIQPGSGGEYPAGLLDSSGNPLRETEIDQQKVIEAAIAAHPELFAADPSGNPYLKWIYFPKDTNGDHQLQPGEPVEVAVTTLDGSGYPSGTFFYFSNGEWVQVAPERNGNVVTWDWQLNNGAGGFGAFDAKGVLVSYVDVKTNQWVDLAPVNHEKQYIKIADNLSVNFDGLDLPAGQTIELNDPNGDAAAKLSQSIDQAFDMLDNGKLDRSVGETMNVVALNVDSNNVPIGGPKSVGSLKSVESKKGLNVSFVYKPISTGDFTIGAGGLPYQIGVDKIGQTWVKAYINSSLNSSRDGATTAELVNRSLRYLVTALAAGKLYSGQLESANGEPQLIVQVLNLPGYESQLRAMKSFDALWQWPNNDLFSVVGE